MDKVEFLRPVIGALRSCVHNHGPINSEWIGSAAKRVVGEIYATIERMGEQRMKPRKMLYVAGPYTAPTAWGIHKNVIRAERESGYLWKYDVPNICPHMNSKNMNGAADESVFYIGGLLMLEACAGVVVVPGWEHSKGTIAEILHALRLGKPVFTRTTQAIEWAKPLSRKTPEECDAFVLEGDFHRYCLVNEHDYEGFVRIYKRMMEKFYEQPLPKRG